MSRNVKILKHTEAPAGSGDFPRILCLTGENKGLAYYLSGSRVVMGRGDRVDIKVLDIKSSREHAEIVKNQNRFVLTDLGSQNGIIVNDLQVKQHILSEGDKIIIGQTVYKFSIVKIGKKEPIIDAPTDVKKSVNKNRIIIYAAVAVALLMLLLPGEDNNIKRKRVESKTTNSVKNLSMSIKKRKKENKDKQKKMAVYLSRGLREYREGNFFRALTEFENALAWSPNDPLALFYLRKTKDALDDLIEKLFNTARREEDSIKYKSAAVSYCSVLRLLYKYPKDPRYKQAEDKILQIEEVLGLEEGELECLQKFN